MLKPLDLARFKRPMSTDGTRLDQNLKTSRKQYVFGWILLFTVSSRRREKEFSKKKQQIQGVSRTPQF